MTKAGSNAKPPVTLQYYTGLLPIRLFDFSKPSQPPKSRTTSKYKPRGASTELYNSTAPEIIISGPAGTGKSRACLEKLHRYASEVAGFRGLIVRKTRASLSETGLASFERDVLGLDHPLVVDGPQRPHRAAYRYPNGGIIATGGMDKAGRILSSEWDMIYCQQAEELAEDDWETLITRLRNHRIDFQQILGCCNPDAPLHWIKQRADTGKTPMLESRHEDNPVLYDVKAGTWTAKGADYMTKLDGLTGVRFHRLRHGRWVAAEGAIYENWDRAIHLIDPFPIPADWRRFRAVDFGYTNPFVCQWWAVDGDGRMYLYREIYHSKRTVRVHAEGIHRYSQGESIEATICDHDAEDRATLHENDIITGAADKRLSVGIDAVIERLKVAGDGKPRLFVFRDAVVEPDYELKDSKRPWATDQEFDGYVWNDKRTKEEPVKEHDHGMDALRYAVMYLDGANDWILW